ncbi:MAG: hypothetical protein MZU91_01760 [Desulfosudis oleivorans]|nr:hypothetical protein [Desulfosudis oleivorans]
MPKQALARGDADLISFGRQHLTDPDFISKVKSRQTLTTSGRAWPATRAASNG